MFESVKRDKPRASTQETGHRIPYPPDPGEPAALTLQMIEQRAQAHKLCRTLVIWAVVDLPARSRVDVRVELRQGGIDDSAKIALVAVTIPAAAGNLEVAAPIQLFCRGSAIPIRLWIARWVVMRLVLVAPVSK